MFVVPFDKMTSFSVTYSIVRWGVYNSLMYMLKALCMLKDSNYVENSWNQEIY